MSETSNLSDNLWIGIRGTSFYHHCNNNRLFAIKSIAKEIKIGSGNTIKTTKIVMLQKR
jgi:hypothetical protein